MTTISTRPASRGAWLIPVGLILLTLIPIISGSLRLTQLSTHRLRCQQHQHRGNDRERECVHELTT